MNKYKINFYLKLSASLAVMMLYLILSPPLVQAITPGTIVYRTTNDGKMFGYSKDPLLEIENGILIGINPGHAGIYIGQENGEDYIVEALAGGIVKTPAKYFVNEALGEELVAARLPREASALDRLKAVMIAKNLADANLDYDLSFQKQKGPGDGEWTCVGLTEKIYESAGMANPGDITALVYDPERYRINITPDGFDNREIVNDEGDCVSKNKEFSKIARREDLSLPLPEIIGYNAGREYRGERYFFLPYTQMIQASLRDEIVDINLSSNFDSKEVRGKTPTLGVLLRWSLINNPASTIKAAVGKVKKVASNISGAIFGKKSNNELVLSSSFKASSSPASTSQSPQEAGLDIVKINTANVSTNTSSKIKTRAEDGGRSEAVNQAENLPIKSGAVNLSQAAKVEVVKAPASTELVSDLFIQSSSALKTAVTKITTAAVASSTAVKAVSSATKIEYSPDSAAASRITTGIKPMGSTSNIPAAGGNNNSPSTAPTTALISKIYATDNNDFIELYNPLDFDFDLAEEGFRLEKTKTAEDPSLMMRIGEAADGYYPKGTIIKAKSFYLIVRDDAAQYYLDMADAIATRKEFSWTGSGYTIYLGKGAISSSADPDTIDAVGFGEAKYFRGVAPAMSVSDNYFLDRIDSKNDNSLDFRLQVIADPDIIWEDSSSNQDNNNQNSDNQNNNNQNDDDQNNQTEENDDNASDIPADFVAFSDPEPIGSSGLVGLWHFDECYGDVNYAVGRFGCATHLRYNYDAIKPVLTQDIDLNKTTFSFYYRNPNSSPGNVRFNLKLKNPNGQHVWLVLEQGLFQLEGLPNSAWRYWGSPVLLDSEWHNFSLVVNKEEGYWAAYFDGIEKYRQAFFSTLPSNFNELEIYGDMYSIFMDELTLWDRPLSPEEISGNWQAAAPFSPVSSRALQKSAELKYFWNFNEGHELVNEGGGAKAIDEIVGLELSLPENSWVWRGVDNSAIVNHWGKDLAVSLPESLNSKDMSLAFWWRSKFYPKNGRSLISLQSNNQNKLALVPDHYRRGFYFNNAYGIFNEGQDIDLPFDESWHHFALTYDSYRYILKMYIDGEEKQSFPFYWLKDGEHPDKLLIKNELNSVELDDLGIWEGSLTPLQIQQIFNSSRAEL